MPRSGELTYYDAIGEAGRRHSLAKPYSDENCGAQFMQIGAILQLLPPVPARVLECGCGTGWLSVLLQKCGYQVVGVDVSPTAIDLCRSVAMGEDREPPCFLVADSERLDFEDVFDAVVFFDALHHSVDEQAAIWSVYRALRPGGVCIASETGPGHHEKSQEVISRFDVTEKDMPPRRIRELGKAAGFRKIQVYPRADEIGKYLFGQRGGPGWRAKLLKMAGIRWLVTLALMTVLRDNYGITVMYK
jgi:SAM-dependent methyltransferase